MILNANHTDSNYEHWLWSTKFVLKSHCNKIKFRNTDVILAPLSTEECNGKDNLY